MYRRRDYNPQEEIFERSAGVDVRDHATLFEVFVTVSRSIQNIRRALDLHCVSFHSTRVRLVPEHEWQQKISTATRARVRRAIGIYQPGEHSCFVRRDPAMDQADSGKAVPEMAKLLTHELVHYGSSIGIHDYSETLNEGMTEYYARAIFSCHVGPASFASHNDPSPFYTRETNIWQSIKADYPDAAVALEKAFWESDPCRAREIVRHQLDEELGVQLAGKDKTDAQIADIQDTLSDLWFSKRLNVAPGVRVSALIREMLDTGKLRVR